jgi:predicted metal-dependent hydrolase
MVAQATEPGAARARHAIRPRNPELAFAGVPRHWFGGSPMATHLVNGVNLLFPGGERFFIRSVRRYMDRIEGDPELLAQVKGFFGQEGRHAQAHERYFEILEAQGYDVRSFLRVYDRLSAVIEKMAPPELRLAVTVALEHFTAMMAENALRERLLDAAHPAMKKLLLWHAAEEIEHKSVAFDVLKKVNPSYGLRMAGMAVAIVTLSGFWMAALAVLLRQDGVDVRVLKSELRILRDHNPVGERVFGRGIREYVRRDFHPSHNDNYGLARDFFASLE